MSDDVELWFLGVLGLLLGVAFLICCGVFIWYKILEFERQRNEMMIANIPNISNIPNAQSIQINDGNEITMHRSRVNYPISHGGNIIGEMLRHHNNQQKGAINSTMTTTATITTTLENASNDDGGNGELKYNDNYNDIDHAYERNEQLPATKRIVNTAKWNDAPNGKRVYSEKINLTPEDIKQISQRSGTDFIEEAKSNREAAQLEYPKVVTVDNALVVPIISIFPDEALDRRKEDISNVLLGFRDALGYTVHPLYDPSKPVDVCPKKYRHLTCDTMKEVVYTALDEFKQNPGCYKAFIIVYLGHGISKNGSDYLCLNGAFPDVSVNTLYGWISDFNCKELQGIPKILINPACRGRQELFPEVPKLKYINNGIGPEQMDTTVTRMKAAMPKLDDLRKRITGEPHTYRNKEEKAEQDAEEKIKPHSYSKLYPVDPDLEDLGLGMAYEPGNKWQFGWESDPTCYYWQGTAPSYLSMYVDKLGSRLLSSIANRLVFHFSRLRKGEPDLEKMPQSVRLSDLQSAVGRMQQLISHVLYEIWKQSNYLTVTYTFGKITDIEFVQNKSAKIRNADLEKDIWAPFDNHLRLVEPSGTWAKNLLKGDAYEEIQHKHLRYSLVDRFTLSDCELKMKNPLVCLMMIGDYSYSSENCNLGVRQDYIDAIECFNYKFNYDILYSKNISFEQAQNKLGDESKDEKADLYTATEILAGGSDKLPDDVLKNIAFQDTWSVKDIRLFIEVQIKETLICQDDMNKYDGIILIVSGYGNRARSVFGSSIWDSFGELYPLDNIRRSFTTQTWFTEIQSCSKIVFLDLEWEYPEKWRKQTRNPKKKVKNVKKEFENFTIKNTDTNKITDDLIAKVQTFMDQAGDNHVYQRLKQMEQDYNYFEYCANCPRGTAKNENNKSSVMLRLLTQHLAELVANGLRTVPQVLCEFHGTCYKKSTHEITRMISNGIIDEYGQVQTRPEKYKVNVIASRLSCDGHAMWCVNSSNRVD